MITAGTPEIVEDDTKRAAERVLIVEDDASARVGLEQLVRSWGFIAESACDGEEALEKVTSFRPAIVITDMVMPRMDGLALLRALPQVGADVTTLLLTAQGTVDTAVEAMKEGAYDYLTKPVDIQRLKILLDKIVERLETMREVKALRRQLREHGTFGSLIGNSPEMRKIYQVVEQAAPTAASVLITGESGTGKELIAQTIHQLSPRAGFPFIAINCAAIPETLLESEIFGHEKGAFTGAADRRQGCFELADRGTLFLDEIGEMTPATQVKLLRVLQERSFRRLGGRTEQTVDVRVIAATNVEPIEAVKQGKLREDLYYRLNVFAFRLPTLRERKEDLPLLVQAFISEFNTAQPEGDRRSGPGGDADDRALRVAGQRARAAERHRARDDPRARTVHRDAPPAAGAHRRAAGAAAAAAGAGAGHDRRGSGAAADRDDPGPHSRQQDARGGDPRHQPEDAAQ